MMEDQLNKIVEAINKLDCTCEIQSDTLILITKNIEEHNIIFELTLPISFPYEFPEIKLSKETYENIPTIPHIYKDNSLCIFDRSKVIPNFLEPISMVLATLNEAFEIIRLGLSHANYNEYNDEFNEYWQNKDITPYVESIINFGEKPLYLKYFFRVDEDELIYYVAHNNEELEKYLKKIRIDEFNKDNFKTCIYIPLMKPIEFPLPKTNLELLAIFKNNSKYYETYYKFMQKNYNHSNLIIFSQIVNDNLIIQAAFQLTLEILVQDGFRKGHINLDFALAGKAGKDTFWKVKVRDLSQNYLFFRGGNGLAENIPKVSIIGCGSIGSCLISSLTQIGITDFNLIDNDILTKENIARHQCGYNMLGWPKTEALNFQLTRHNPNIECMCFCENAHEFLEKKQDILNRSDITFIAVGNLPLEYHALELHRLGLIVKPLIILWIEPFAVGGHALIIQKPQDVFNELFDSELFSYKFNIVKNPDIFLKREPGCQSTFMPYSGFDVQRFVNNFLDYYMKNFISKQKIGNYRFSWFGDITEAKLKEIDIEDEYLRQENYSFIIKRFD